ncbi:MAG TPA: hypothetical protein DEF51_54890 [Myxococcales bacterium]|nr:hypothetical protein [Myxococcales bacterium]
MPVRSRHGLTVCPRCRAHVEAGERPSTTVCPFCEKGTSISQVGRSGVLAGALLAFACGGAEAPPPEQVEPQTQVDPQPEVFEPAAEENVEVEAYGMPPEPEAELEPEPEEEAPEPPPPDEARPHPMYGIAP